MRARITIAATALALFGLTPTGCSEPDPTDPMDAGGTDAATTPDAGGTDAATTPDAGGTDAAQPADAGGRDGGSVDAGWDAGWDDAGTDAGPTCDDGDGDGYGDGCSAGLDCDDGDDAVHPDAAESCDGTVDDDCDGTVDEGCSNDPFDPASCSGVAWTGADALARLMGGSREVLASATIQVRTRSCPGGTCGPWSAASDWQTRYLTYSGGVTTRWMNVQADTRLVLFDDAGDAELSVQHVTFPAGGYDDDQGMVFGFPPTPITYPHFRAYNVAPEYSSDYRDLDIQLKDGELHLGDGCARFTAHRFGDSEPFTTEYAALYRW